MLRLPGFIAALSLSAFGGGAAAAEATTVQGLLSDGYAVTSSFMTQIGPGIFLQKSGKLFLCFVSEKRETQEITTQYCKPVR